MNKIIRPLTPADFEKKNEINAICIKGSSHLKAGKRYNVRFKAERKRVSIPAEINPGYKSNGGMEFSIRSFGIEE